MYHQSVLLYESIKSLNIDPSGIYVDGTFGLGGHSKLILSKLSRYGRLIAMDRDLKSVKVGKLLALQDNRFSIVHEKFSKMFKYISDMNLIGLINGIFLDLGLSSYQLMDATRGFSFIKDGPLDMRMDVSTGQSAAKWIATASQKNIEWVLKTFGEERFSKKISKSIVYQRRSQPIVRTYKLSEIISNSIPNRNRYNQWKHPATRSFLAIRMYINEELLEITKLLKDVFMLLCPGGRLVIISFNSLEDRLVKHFIYQHSQVLPILPKLALTETQLFNMYSSLRQFKYIGRLRSTYQEVKNNIQSRSAILRCAEKLHVTKNIVYDK